MKTNIEKFCENLHKEKWRKFKFSEIAYNIVEKVTPRDSELKHYIGLEHLDAGSPHIKRFGDPASLEGDKLKIYKGDIIVGKRNAYLKRASVAPFDAIASAHSFVLRANENAISPRFFPFLMLSEPFWETAIRISVGSLSPTINWKTLAIQEFSLPPIDYQEKLAELLWAGDELITLIFELLERLKKLYQSVEKEAFEGEDAKLKIVPLSDVAWFQEGPGLRNWQFKTSGIKVINVTNILDGYLDLSLTNRHVDLDEFNKTYKHFECDENDIVVASSGNSYCKHAVVRKKDLPLMMNTSVIRFKPINGFEFEFLNIFLSSRNFKYQIDKLIEGGAQPNFGPYHLKKITIPYLDKEKRNALSLKILKINKIKSEVEKHFSILSKIQNSIINNIFQNDI